MKKALIFFCCICCCVDVGFSATLELENESSHPLCMEIHQISNAFCIGETLRAKVAAASSNSLDGNTKTLESDLSCPADAMKVGVCKKDSEIPANNLIDDVIPKGPYYSHVFTLRARDDADSNSVIVEEDTTVTD